MDVQKSNDINDNSSNYFCEKSKKWINDNRDLVYEAKSNEWEFAALINKLEFDNNLKNNEKVFIYDDICKNYWHNEHRFEINVDYESFNFFGGIFERQMYDF